MIIDELAKMERCFTRVIDTLRCLRMQEIIKDCTYKALIEDMKLIEPKIYIQENDKAAAK